MKEEYKIVVLRAYKEKKEAGELSINLTHPTCANVRNEVLARFRAGCSKSDLRMLQDFLERTNDDGLYDKAIKRCDPEKFKPLINFLRRETNTHEKNVELLAWLIDFHCRPSTKYYCAPPIKANANDVFARKTSSHPSEVYLPSDIQELALDLPTGVTQTNAKKRYAGSTYEYNSPAKERIYDNQPKKQVPKDESYNPDNFYFDKRIIKKEVTIEYPSGAKLSVDANDLSLIAQLIRL